MFRRQGPQRLTRCLVERSIVCLYPLALATSLVLGGCGGATVLGMSAASPPSWTSTRHEVTPTTIRVTAEANARSLADAQRLARAKACESIVA